MLSKSLLVQQDTTHVECKGPRRRLFPVLQSITQSTVKETSGSRPLTQRPASTLARGLSAPCRDMFNSYNCWITISPPRVLKGQPAQFQGHTRRFLKRLQAYLGLTLTPTLSRPILSVHAFRPTAINTWGKDLETDPVELPYGFSFKSLLSKTPIRCFCSDRFAIWSSGWLMGTYSVVLPLNHLIGFGGFGRHLQPAGSACFQLFDLSHRRRTWSFSALADHVLLRFAQWPWWGRICGGTSLRAPPCILQRGWPCPGQSPSAEWSAPWWWRPDPGWPGNRHTPEPHMTPQSPGSFPGNKAAKRGHRWQTQNRFKKGQTEKDRMMKVRWCWAANLHQQSMLMLGAREAFA